MILILKYILVNIKDKKFRTLLIILSIIFSSGMLYFSFAVTNELYKAYEQNSKRLYGEADYIVYSKEKAKSNFIDINFLKDQKDNFKIASIFNANSILKIDKDYLNFNAIGVDLEEYLKISPIDFIKYKNTKFVGENIIISNDLATKLKVDIGDIIKIKVNGVEHNLKLFGIAEDCGVFEQDVYNNYVLMPLDYLQMIYDKRGRVSTILIKSKENNNDLIKDYVESRNSNVIIEKINLKSEVEVQVRKIILPFKFITILSILISFYILYSSYRVMIYQRLPIIGTFRSIGSSMTMTNGIFILESMIYGTIGAVFGIFFGNKILSIIVNDQFKNVEIVISRSNLIYMFLVIVISIMVSGVSSFLPLIKISKYSLKNIIFNMISTTNIKYKLKLFLSIVLIISVLILMNIDISIKEIYKGIIIMTSILLLIILVNPFYTITFTKIIDKIFNVSSNSAMWIAIRNLRTNRNLVNNISLIGIGISCMITINILSSSIFNSINEEFERNMNFQIYLIPFYHTTKSFESRLNIVEGVDNSYGVYSIFDAKIKNQNAQFKKILGIDTSKHKEFVNQKFESNIANPIDELDRSRNLILSTMLKNKLNLKLGEQIEIVFNNYQVKFNIIAFVDSIENNGDIAYISNKYIKTDFKIQHINNFYIKTRQNYDINSVIQKIKSSYFEQKFIIVSTNDLKEKYLNIIEKYLK